MRILSYHIGPRPRNRETMRHYLLRWSLFMWTCAAALFLVTAGISYLGFKISPSLDDSPVIMATVFGLVILSAMGVLGGFHALCTAIFRKDRHMVWDYEGRDPD